MSVGRWSLVTVAAGVLLSAACLAPEFVDIQRSAYFNVDDFDNVYWTYNLSPGQMFGFVVDPTFAFFRPMGMVWYWLLGRAFNLDPVAFHAFQTALNLLNVGLVGLLVLVLSRSRTAAVLTPLLWITSITLIEALWWFGSIFFIFCTTCLVLAVLGFATVKNWVAKSIVVVVAYLLAIKTQEAAVTLPAVLLAYEILLQPTRLRPDGRPRLALYVILGAVAAVFTYLKVHSMSGGEATGAYVYSFTFDTLQQNFAWYAAQLFPWLPQDNPGVAPRIIVAVAVCAVALQDRIMVFGLIFGAITLIPVVFLVDHLFAFYWYLSGIGLWLSIGQLAARIGAATTRRLALDRRGVVWLAPAALNALALALVEVQARQYRDPRVDWTRAYAATFRTYVESIVAQPDPPPGAIVNVRGAPTAFDAVGLSTLYRVLYNRADITVRAVDRESAQATRPVGAP